MLRIMKILGGLFAGLILFLILMALLLPILFDKDDLKQKLADVVMEKTNRQLSINGDLNFSVFPWLAVEVNELSLGNAPGFPEKSFASIDQARLGVRLLPLLSKRIEVGMVTLDGLALNLEIKTNGHSNWQDLISEDEDDSRIEDEEPGVFDSQGIAGLRIRGAQIDYKDAAAGAHYTLSDFSLESGALGSGEPVSLEMNMKLDDQIEGRSAAVEIKTTLGLDLEDSRFDFTDLSLQADVAAPDLPDGRQQIYFNTPELKMDLSAQTLESAFYSMKTMGLDLTGDLAASNIVDAPRYRGQIEVSDFSPREVFKQLRIEVPVTADPDVLTRARLSTNFSGDTDKLTFSNLDMRMDQSQLTGEMSVLNFDAPAVSFDLVLDRIELDRYLEPSADTDEEASAAGIVDIELPVDLLEGLDVNGRFRIGTVLSAGMTFTDLQAGVRVERNRLRLHPLSAKFYGGTYGGDIRMDGSGDVPVLSIDENISGIQFAEMATDLFNGAPLSGTANGHARLSGKGRTTGEVTRNLKGDIALALIDGAWEGTNLWYEIRKALAVFKRQEAPAAPTENRTLFSRMRATATVSGGVMTTDDLVAELPFLRVTGGGSVDLADSTIDMSLMALIRSDPELQNDALTGDLAGKRLPLKITGSLDDPSVQPDFALLLKEEAKERVKEKLLEKLGLGRLLAPPAQEPEEPATDEEPAPAEEEPQSPEEELKEKVKDKLKDLFGGG